MAIHFQLHPAPGPEPSAHPAAPNHSAPSRQAPPFRQAPPSRQAPLVQPVSPARAAPSARPPILLVHGFASNTRLSWADTGWLDAIRTAGRACITVDLRGHGLSERSHDSAAYTPPRMVADLIEVMDATGTDTVDVIGYSMGCRIALALAETTPGRVRRLVLGGIGTRELFASWDRSQVEGFLLRGEPLADPLVQTTLTIAASIPGNDPQALLACIRGMAGPPIESSPVPTLVVAGDRDDVASDAVALAQRIGAAFVPVPKRHHFTAVSSRVFKEAALDFLA